MQPWAASIPSRTSKEVVPKQALGEVLFEQRFEDGVDGVGERVVGVGDPVDGRGRVEGDVELRGAGEANDYAGGSGDEGGAEVVGVAGEGLGEAVLLVGERTNVDDHAVVSGDEFVELAAGGDVLIVEYEGVLPLG